MKILSLRFKNLNSLVGEWKIDFTHPQYLADGIFAISGPTGAGKSTILDAICLALYGKTPRLSTISTTTNQIMSRKTKECFAEVVFESNKGRFKCHWSQTMAKSLKLQPAKFEIYDCTAEKIIASKIKETSEAIIERTGMDFNRFTQSMLLAQGGFAKFLQATTNERAPILEEITGTEIYRSISKNVFDRCRSEIAILDRMKAETEGIQILKPEELEMLQSELIVKQSDDKKLTELKTNTDNAIKWLNDIELIISEIEKLNNDENIHQLTLQAFLPEREMLTKANKAHELEADYVKLTNLRTLQIMDKNEVSKKEQQRPELNNKIETATLLFTRADEALRSINTNSTAQFDEIKTVREIDVNIVNATKNLSASNIILTNLAQQKLDVENEIERLKKRIEDTLLQAKTANEYIDTNAQDESLVQKFEAIKLLLDGFIDKKRIAHKHKTDLSVAEENSKRAAKAIDNMRLVLKSAHDKCVESKHIVKIKQDEIQNLLKHRPLLEYRNDLNHLQEKQNLLNQIKNLEEQRKTLEDGKECPLCGSVHHPFAEGNIPDVDETKQQIGELKAFIANIETLESALKVAEKSETELVTAFNKVENELTILESKHIDCKTEYIKSVDAEAETQKELLALQSNINLSLRPWGLSAEEHTNTIVTILQARLTKWQQSQRIRTESDTVLSEIRSKISTQEALLLSIDDSWTIEKTKNRTLTYDVTILRETRTNIYANKDPNIEETKLKKEIEQANWAERNAKESLSALKNELSTLNNRVNELKANILDREAPIVEAESDFANLLTQCQFAHESEFILCRLEKTQRENLANRAKALDDKTAELKTRKADREFKLITEQNKKLTDLPKDSLLAEQAAIESLISETKERIGAINQKIISNEKAQIEMGEKLENLELQRKHTRKWEALNDLIGQADGTKFSRFAQGITFEIMVSHANIQLTKLTDRYLLQRDKDEPLDLNVIDNYQAGECRSTKNLSGGESFIISLALALGLSNMSSKNVSIDSLFLDEGFGTLDEDTLETALNTLASLRQEGKLIGVISHVGSLKDRISAKIDVTKGTAGKSTLSGPGVMHVTT